MITSITAWNIRQPSSPRAWAALRLATSDGLEGWGECRPLTSADLASLKTQLTNKPASAFEALRIQLNNHPSNVSVPKSRTSPAVN